MEKNHHIWRIWSNTLHRWGVEDLVAYLLEAAGPLTVIAAQLIYIGQPILRGLVPEKHLVVLSALLEDDVQRAAFVNYIRDGVQL